MSNQEYIKYARMIDAGKLPLKTTAIPPGCWEKAQKIVALTLGASNETYIHPTLLYGLCEHVAEGLADYFELGWKGAGGTIVDHKGGRLLAG